MNICGLRTSCFIIVGWLVMMTSCRQNYSPRPKGFIRIDLPEKNYQLLDTMFPYSFMYPGYSLFIPDERDIAEPYWANIVFPEFKGTLHLSYKTVGSTNDLKAYFEDARSFTQRHIPKATAMRDELFIDEENNVYGVLFQIKGREVASPIQFYLTDSTQHFLRGALYFNVVPNNDSLAPVIDFLEEDIRYMIETTRWNFPVPGI
jgi:gliding motility-associated lipoprotein GldD